MEAFEGWVPQAVVFDCDGLLVDTEPCWTVAETELFARRGLPFGADEKALIIGRSVPEAGAVLAEHFGEPGEGPAIARELLQRVREVIAAQAEAMPGAQELVALVAGVVPVAVASNSPRALLDVALERGGLDDVFGVRVAADEVASPKPHPELYLAACERLGVDPVDALAFEDSETGLRSARAAGLRIVGVPTLAHRELAADVVLASLADPALVEWCRGWGSSRLGSSKRR